MFLSPPDIGHKTGDKCGSQNNNRAAAVENGTFQRQQSAQDADQTCQEEALSSKPVGFAPDFLTGDCPGCLDPHIEIALEFRHHISNDQK